MDTEKTFYVVYNTVTEQYQNENGGFGSYAEAEQFHSVMDAEWSRSCTITGTRIVGPCIEGETP